jgi:putative endonuclease
MYYVYILKSSVDGSLYKGYTHDLKERVRQHNAGRSEYTSRKRPWKVVYYEIIDSKEQAIKRERYFKSAAGRRFLNGQKL